MVLLGAFVNAVCIVFGTLLGRALRNIPDKMKETVLQGIGIAIIALGLQMGFESSNFVIVIISLVFGTVLGEWWDLDRLLNNTGKFIERKLGTKENQGSLAQGFVTATLIFVIGAMGVIGSLESGLTGEHKILYSKGVIDGFTSIVLASTLGIGVLLSAVPVFVYQGFIALFATQIKTIVPEDALDLFVGEMTATGGLMIVAIGLNLLGLMKVRVANMLPGILVTAVIVTVLYQMGFV
ncbi:DUF554 domain-containing protein [Indiicoccus explosivorum]|uniref:DUF554 domain-containing protein n=1 Tax=Indiicoccus explosivorum TaxID=1917864 RepID=UPI000B44944C|nr:DUF554 domain-containing protein [Indiicoccus explosivorum]